MITTAAADALRTVFLLCLFAGLVSILRRMNGLVAPAYSWYLPGMVVLAAMAAAKRLHKAGWLIVLGVAVLLLAWQMRAFDKAQRALRSGNTLIEEIWGLGWWISGSSSWTSVNLTGLAPSISVLLAVLVFAAGALVPVPFVLLLLLAGFCLFEMLIGAQLRIGDLALAAGGILGVAGLRASERSRSENGSQSAVPSGLTVAAVLAAAMLLTAAAFGGREEVLFDTAERIQQRANDIADEIRERRNMRLNRGGVYDSRTPVLEVSLTNVPERDIYLRSFTGGTYDGGVWYMSDETQAFDELYADYGDLMAYRPVENARKFREWLELPRYARSSALGQSADIALKKGNAITIRRLHPEDTRTLGTYGQTWFGEWQADTNEKQGYYTEFSQMDPDMAAFLTYVEEKGASAEDSLAVTIDQREAELRWERLIRAEETQIPQGQLPRLSAWSRIQRVRFEMPEVITVSDIPGWNGADHRQYTVDPVTWAMMTVEDRYIGSSYYAEARQEALGQLKEITARVYRLLETHAVYTKEPETTPYEEEIIEYFLFTGHEGYCQQYATAEVLAYRMLGVPARYCTGYRIPAGWFLRDGMKVTVTGELEHAWAEIWLFGYGWVPVEMTLLREELSGEIFPGYPAEEMIVRLDELAAEERAAIQGDYYEEEEEYYSDLFPTDPIGRTERRQIDRRVVTIVTVSALAAAAVLWYVVFRLRRRARRTVRGWFVLLVRMLHVGGWLRGFTGSEEDFADSLVSVLSYAESPTEEYRWLTERAETEYFGGRTPSREENRRAKKLFIRTQDWLFARANTGRSLKMRLFCMLFA